MRVEFSGGAYTARSIISGCQRAVNVFPEPANPDAPAKVVMYERPGLVVKATPATSGAARCEYRATNGELFRVVGNKVIYVSSAFVQTVLGTITTTTGIASMSDNGIGVVLVDGSTNGYYITIPGHVMTNFSGAEPAFYGSDSVWYTDTFFVFNRPNTQQYYLSPPNWDGATPFDALDVAAKVGGADNIAAIAVVKGDIWGIGTLTTQPFTNVGAADFPFLPVQGVLIDQGTVAKYSVAQTDLSVFWLSQDTSGHAILIEGKDYAASRVSNFAVENEWQRYETISDAVGFVYQQGGHTFYQITFPTADKTWVYDMSFPDPMGAWHERTWTDGDGQEHRHRAQTCAFAYGVSLVGDWETGKLYQQDVDVRTDDGGPIVRRRSFPHLVSDGNRISYNQFVADISVGEGEGYVVDSPPMISLRWSDTRGASWGNPVMQSSGATGQYYTSPSWRRLGMARDRVFELFWSEPVPCALQGAWIDVTPAGT